MKSVLLIGMGRFGRHVAMKMSKLNHQIMAVDKCEENIEKILPYVTNAQIGDSTNEEFLRSLGVNDYDLAIVAISEDFQSSLETTSLLKELGAKMIISRAETDIHAKFLSRNGADEVIYPERQVADWTAIRYTADHILNYVEINDEYAIYEVEIPSNWIGKTIMELDIRRKYNVNVIAMRKNGKLSMSISPDQVLEKNQSLLVVGEYDNIQKCFHI